MKCHKCHKEYKIPKYSINVLLGKYCPSCVKKAYNQYWSRDVSEIINDQVKKLL